MRHALICNFSYSLYDVHLAVTLGLHEPAFYRSSGGRAIFFTGPRAGGLFE